MVIAIAYDGLAASLLGGGGGGGDVCRGWGWGLESNRCAFVPRYLGDFGPEIRRAMMGLGGL